MAAEEQPLPVRCICDADAAEDAGVADGHDAAAEAFAALVCVGRGRPCDLAMLASVRAFRSMRLAADDPARSADYRLRAESLFNAVEETGDPFALGIVAFVLNELADTDEAANVRLNRIVGTLTTEQARLFRDAVRWSQKENSKRSEPE